jgi:transcriptional regulator with XRE-family HTH domain
MAQELSFGALIQKLRRAKGWTVKQFIEKLEVDISPAYIARIELHGEIPSPELMIKIASVFDYNEAELWECAKNIKIKKFENSLERKYQQAVGMYRTQKKKKG